MAPHEEFLELCAAATAGELNTDERAKLDAHLAECTDCRRAMREYEVVTTNGVPSLASELARNEESADGSWSVEDAEKRFFKKLDEKRGDVAGVEPARGIQTIPGGRFTYRPSQFRWREIWMPLAAAVLLAVPLGVALYGTGLRRGRNAARLSPPVLKTAEASLEAQASDAGYERTQLLARLADSDKVIEDLKRQLSEQIKSVHTLQSVDGPATRP